MVVAEGREGIGLRGFRVGGGTMSRCAFEVWEGRAMSRPGRACLAGHKEGGWCWNN